MASATTTIDNPFAFRAYDNKMDSNNAVNYIPPEKRKLIKDYLTKSSLQYYASQNQTKPTYESTYNDGAQVRQLDVQQMMDEREKASKKFKVAHIYLGRENIFKTQDNRDKSPSIDSEKLNHSQSVLDVSNVSGDGKDTKSTVEIQKHLRSNLRAHHFQLGYRGGDTYDQTTADKQINQELAKQYLEQSNKVSLRDQVLKNKESNIVLGTSDSKSMFERKRSTSNVAQDILEKSGTLNFNTTFDFPQQLYGVNKPRYQSTNKQSHIQLGKMGEVPEWNSTTMQHQQQANQFEYKPIGKYERTNQYTKSQFQIGQQEQLPQIENRNTLIGLKLLQASKKEDQLLTQLDKDNILNEMRRKHINLGGQSYIPNESTSNSALKQESSPNKKDLTMNYENRNLRNNMNFNDAMDPSMPNSVYLNFHNKDSGRVDPKNIQDNKQKIQYYKDRILNTQVVLGEDKDPSLHATTVVGKDYQKYEDVDKSYIESIKKQEENKQVIEKQNHNIFQHNGIEMQNIRRIQPSNFNVKKQDNRELFNSLKKSYLHFGHEEKNNRDSTSTQAYNSVDAKLNSNQYSEQKRQFEQIKIMNYNGNITQVGPRSNSNLKTGGSAYKDQFIWKKPKYDI